MDPGAAKREIRLSHYMLWYLRLQGRRLAKRRRWIGPADEFLARQAASTPTGRSEILSAAGNADTKSSDAAAA